MLVATMHRKFYQSRVPVTIHNVHEQVHTLTFGRTWVHPHQEFLKLIVVLSLLSHCYRSWRLRVTSFTTVRMVLSPVSSSYFVSATPFPLALVSSHFGFNTQSSGPPLPFFWLSVFVLRSTPYMLNFSKRSYRVLALPSVSSFPWATVVIIFPSVSALRSVLNHDPCKLRSTFAKRVHPFTYFIKTPGKS